MRLNEGYSYKEGRKGHSWDVKGIQVRLSHVVWPEKGEKGERTYR